MRDMNSWICASCNTEQTGDRVQHFISAHYFYPSNVGRTTGTIEESGLFNDRFFVAAKCPVCQQMGDMEISHTERSIKLECANKECGQVKLYRQVIDRPPVKGEVNLTV